jgi:TPR repeat protein
MAPPNSVTLNSVAPRPVVTRPAAPAAHQMNNDDIAMLMKQAEQFISAGDVVTARVLFQRAAEAGDAKAALSLGATFDPALLAKMGVRGIAADIEKARAWYEKARDLGSFEARTRLETLATR